MNILEAVKTKRSIRRPCFPQGRWLSLYLVMSDMPSVTYCLDREDILAEDWEILSEKLELSWEQIEEAMSGEIFVGSAEQWGSSVKKRLGFKD